MVFSECMVWVCGGPAALHIVMGLLLQRDGFRLSAEQWGDRQRRPVDCSACSVVEQKGLHDLGPSNHARCHLDVLDAAREFDLQWVASLGSTR